MASPLEMSCFKCNENGCNECKNTGKIKVTCCPLELITSDVWEIITLAELFGKGLPPVAGGVLDQAKIFVESARFVFYVQNYVKHKLGIVD